MWQQVAPDLADGRLKRVGKLLQRTHPAKAAGLLDALLSYAEDTAGGLMNADTIEVRADVRVGTVLRYLRLLENLPPQTDMLMVVDRDGRYEGGLNLSALLTANTETRVADLMHTDVVAIPVDLPAAEVGRGVSIGVRRVSGAIADLASAA